MFEHILVPLDGSSLSETSLDAAAVLAARLGSSVTLLHVIEQDAPAEVHKERHLTRPDEAEEYLKRVAAREFDSGITVRTHVHTAPVADVAASIVAHATSELRPDLIVTCTHGRSGVRDLLFGSIAQQIVAQGTTPLLLIKPGSQRFKISKMLVPLDQDSMHDEGLPPAEFLAKSFGAEIHLLSVIPTYGTLSGEQGAASSLMPATTQAMLDLREEHASDHLKLHLDALGRLGIRAAATVARGDAASGILKTAEESGADLIVLSTHGKAGLGAFWSRSVSPSVAQRTQIPLLLLPLQH